MSEVTKIDRAAEVKEQTPVSSADAIISVIERAVSNPDVDIDKMERLLEMQQRVMATNARAAYYSALADMQTELPAIPRRGAIKNKNGGVQSRYALWEDINDAIKPVLAKYGFALSFRTGRDDRMITVTGVLSHREGHSEETMIALPQDESGSKNNVQGVGSSTSYGKRYVAQALLNLTSYDEDDDGQAAGRGKTITDEQCNELLALADSAGADKRAFCEWLGVDSFTAIPANQFGKAKKALERKKAKNAGS
jgi:hypothetical protein